MNTGLFMSALNYELSNYSGFSMMPNFDRNMIAHIYYLNEGKEKAYVIHTAIPLDTLIERYEYFGSMNKLVSDIVEKIINRRDKYEKEESQANN